MKFDSRARHNRSIFLGGPTTPVPGYVNEVISDVRCIKPGWYAMDDVGNLFTGPFLSKAECFRSITQLTFESVRLPPS